MRTFNILKLTNWVPRPEKPAPDPITHINAVMDDELVSTLKEGQFVKVNAIVEIDHLPKEIMSKIQEEY